MTEEKKLSVVFIGSGNVATHLAGAFSGAGHRVVQIYSRSLQNARLLGEKYGATFTDCVDKIYRDADLYLFAVKDDVLPELIRQMPVTSGVWVHTAGSLPLSLFAERGENYGVFYPLQTFTKGRELNFSEIPIFVEGDSTTTEEKMQAIAQTISDNVNLLSSEKRKYLHLAAVFACNFTNHMYALASEIVENQQIPFEVLQPLIAETASKIMQIAPQDAQTGPAVRLDETVMQNHLKLLTDNCERDIYTLLSQNIHIHARRKE